MEKILLPYTIIPEHLYVNRDADRQITEAIQNMGRPGYVLVSRQMGKTNLLINAKNRLQTKNDVFIYIDLSNSFESPRECFRSIINKAIETHLDIFGEVYKIIESNRSKRNLPPHTEHGHELRLLLNSITGKFIIILDEIDSLTKAKFSDEIFAQIRSIYFERVNFNEYNRLTYLLSGVVEPSEIIKDPKISPFNIGQKIFLNDFTFKEFLSFTQKANFKLNDSLLNKIFEWTNGNPRITYDICSEIENSILEGTEITPSIIDSIIEKIYLTAFDKAPIDHIRELVESDNEIRDAIIQIRYHKGNTLSDAIKKKLYLAGIINSDFTSEIIFIKNKIIDKSLSESWIESIEIKKKGTLKVAIEKYKNEEFSEAIILFEEFILNNGILNQFEKYTLGKAYYKQGEYKKAIQPLLEVNFDKKGFTDLYFETIYTIGVCYFYIDDFENCIKMFLEVIDDNPNGKFYYLTLLNLASCYYNYNIGIYKGEAIRLNNKIIEDLAKEINSENSNENQYLVTLAYYNLGKIYQAINDISTALDYFQKCLNACDINDINFKPKIIYELYTLENSDDNKANLLENIVNVIIENRLTVKSTIPKETLSLTQEFINAILIRLLQYEDHALFDKLLKYTLKLDLNTDSVVEILFPYSIQLINQKKTNIGLSILTKIIDILGNKITNPTILNVFKILAVLGDQENYKKYNSIYIQHFLSNYSEIKLIHLDFNILYRYLCDLIEKKDTEKYQQLFSIIYSLLDKVDDQSKINYAIFFLSEIQLLEELGLKEPVITKAKSLFEFINKYKIIPELSLLGNEQIDNIRKYVLNIINRENISFQTNIASLQTKQFQYERNQRVIVKYIDGRIIEKKYKQVEEDIQKGVCYVFREDITKQSSHLF